MLIFPCFSWQQWPCQCDMGGEVPSQDMCKQKEHSKGCGRSHLAKKSRQLPETLCSPISPQDSQVLECPLSPSGLPCGRYLASPCPSLPPKALRPRGPECADLGSDLSSATCWLSYLGHVTHSPAQNFGVLICKLEGMTPTRPLALLLGLNIIT